MYPSVTCMKTDLSTLQKKMGFAFKNENLLLQALTHRSYLNENRSRVIGHNERLEFLGDAVLELIISDHLFEHFADKEEGALTEIRSSLVNRNMTSSVAGLLDLNSYVFLSRGEQKDMKARAQILANTLEAIIGALYKDQGYEAARTFVGNFFLKNLPSDVEKMELKDPKSMLQEIAQERVGFTPHYKTLEEQGCDHEKTFTVGAFVGTTMLSKGTGPSKAKAKKQAAENALKSMT